MAEIWLWASAGSPQTSTVPAATSRQHDIRRTAARIHPVRPLFSRTATDLRPHA
jgi:hypothetical protein